MFVRRSSADFTLSGASGLLLGGAGARRKFRVGAVWLERNLAGGWTFELDDGVLMTPERNKTPSNGVLSAATIVSFVTY